MEEGKIQILETLIRFQGWVRGEDMLKNYGNLLKETPHQQASWPCAVSYSTFIAAFKIMLYNCGTCTSI
jgi:hypothetical protein